MAEFIVRYRAIVYRPFKGETVDGVVGNVNKVCSYPTQNWSCAQCPDSTDSTDCPLFRWAFLPKSGH